MLADRIGPRKFMICGTAFGALTVVPAFYLIDQRTVFGMVSGELVLVLIVSGFGPGLPAWMVAAAPTEVRYTIVGAGYNLAQAVLGGTAPLIATAVYGVGGSAVWTGGYFAFIALLSMTCLCFDARNNPAGGARGYEVQLNESGSDGDYSPVVLPKGRVAAAAPPRP